MKKYSLSAVVAAGLMAGGLATSANAADLGGNCCADLEERVAELEATTARKGNRKVSLTVSGWVAEQVMFWDDGFESNTYVSGLGTTLGTNVKFTGSATISPGWSAGYVLHLEVDGSDSLTINQNKDNGPGVYAGTQNYVQTIQSFWFIKSDHWGKVGIGLQSQASDNTAILVDGSGSLVPANWVLFDVNSFFVHAKGTGRATSGATVGAFGGCAGHGGAGGDCNGLTTNSVRYDTPTFAGFSASASWGEDDFWDIALRYAGEHHGFKVAIAAAYDETTDCGGTTGCVTSNGAGGAGGPITGDLNYFQIGAYIQHIGTGLFLYGAYGDLEENGNTAATSGEGQSWYIKGGVRGKWNHLGATIPYIEYWEAEGDDSVSSLGSLNSSSDLQVWGLGIVQEIDAAAMSMWLKYRNYEFDDSTTTAFDDFNEFTFGGLINF